MFIAHLEYSLDDSILTQRVLHMRIGVGDVRQAMNRIAGKIRRKRSVPGFRKGRGPLALYRFYHRKRISHEAFEELKQQALKQVMKQLGDEHQPFIPPEVEDRKKIHLSWFRPLEFSVKLRLKRRRRDSNPRDIAA